MDIEIIQTVLGAYRLFDGDRFLADCGKGPEGKDRAKAVWDEITNLQTACSELRGDVEQLTRQRDAALAACRAVATNEAEDPCRYDHHGYCQAHGLQPKGECYMELARAAIKLMEEPSS